MRWGGGLTHGGVAELTGQHTGPPCRMDTALKGGMAGAHTAAS